MKTKVTKTSTRKSSKRTRNPSNEFAATMNRMSALTLSQSERLGRTLTADELADCFEAEAKKLQGIADVLRGKN